MVPIKHGRLHLELNIIIGCWKIEIWSWCLNFSPCPNWFCCGDEGKRFSQVQDVTLRPPQWPLTSHSTNRAGIGLELTCSAPVLRGVCCFQVAFKMFACIYWLRTCLVSSDFHCWLSYLFLWSVFYNIGVRDNKYSALFHNNLILKQWPLTL